jgi:hypothetical protein
MNRIVLRKCGLHGLKLLSILATGACIVSSALAQNLYFSGPSLTKLSEPTKFSGNGFAPNAAVTVTINAPGGSAAGYSAVTDPNGAFSYTLVPTVEGVYTVAVADSGGRALASALVSARP